MRRRAIIFSVLYTAMIAFTISLMSCKNGKPKQVAEDEIGHSEVICCCPPTVLLQSFNSFTEEEARAMIPKMKKLIKEGTGLELDFDVLPRIILADSMMNDIFTRYRADRIIPSLKDNHHDVVVGLLHDDISCTYKGKKDWGVLGLSLTPKYKNCVASDFRLKHKKRDLWKVATHEFFHAVCNMHHCPKDDPRCIMKDAEGHADFSNKEHMCKTCRELCHL